MEIYPLNNIYPPFERLHSGVKRGVKISQQGMAFSANFPRATHSTQPSTLRLTLGGLIYHSGDQSKNVIEKVFRVLSIFIAIMSNHPLCQT